jgi:uncharacterized protein (TIGR03437 family)
MPVIQAVTSAADTAMPIAPGALISIWGTGLSASADAAGAIPLPRSMSDVCLYVDSASVPLLYVSPTQVNAQLPFEAQAGANMLISNSGGRTAPFPLTIQSSAPAVFRTAQGGPTIIRLVDGKLITDATPIHLNQQLTIYLTGLGSTDPGVTSGDASPFDPPAITTTTPAVTIGGAAIWTLWSGLAPGMVGVNQINVQLPFHHIPTGHNIPFTITQGGSSTTVLVRVEE